MHFLFRQTVSSLEKLYDDVTRVASRLHDFIAEKTRNVKRQVQVRSFRLEAGKVRS